MKAALEINGKLFVPVKQAAEYFDYSRDHVTRLAKAKKIDSAKLGRLWYVSEQSLKNYFEDQRIETQVRKEMLRKNRQTELQLRSAVVVAETNRSGLAQNSNKVAVVFACLFFGLLLAAASQIVPTSAVSVASLGWSAPVSSATTEGLDVQVTQPVFSYQDSKDKVLVDNSGRWVEKPEVTPQWVQITP